MPCYDIHFAVSEIQRAFVLNTRYGASVNRTFNKALTDEAIVRYEYDAFPSN